MLMTGSLPELREHRAISLPDRVTFHWLFTWQVFWMPATETATPLLQVVVSQAVNFSQVRYRQLGHYSGDRTGLIATVNLAGNTAQ